MVTHEVKVLTPLLLLSSGRSGTTLLMQLLGTSNQIVFDRVYPFEVRYLTYLLRWAQILRLPANQDEAWNASENANGPLTSMGPFPHVETELWNGSEWWSECFRQAWKQFSRAAEARDSQSYLSHELFYYAEKTPAWVPALLSGIIPYKLIILIRDPRDVFLSITAFDKKRGYCGFSRRPDDDDWSFARRFVADCQAGFKIFLEYETRPSTIVLHYEKLLLNLFEQTERLNTWLGVTLDPTEVERRLLEFGHHFTSKTKFESVQRWRRELPEDLNKFFIENLSDHLIYFGYEN